MSEEDREIEALILVRQIARMTTTDETKSEDSSNGSALDSLILRAREITA